MKQKRKKHEEELYKMKLEYNEKTKDFINNENIKYENPNQQKYKEEYQKINKN